ncbi:ABC transporter ATP-binding protein [Dactylosporangium sp. AC04546]|uniref:ABC transporter ATP-binding protein n=1 Tax=Dactylosporangium sp. AC04546 TaxID=2862460 RepID=UPI001EDCD59C|nr:ABC transporter ATP-binding protein [Dactylosporangium sp. AC04546]WVK88709.1 ABC transporter ATP-binding protein [Dactylosporangium sp. AC04546]
MDVFTGEHLVRAFGPATAVRDVTCVVPADARIAVTGVSGSGKSTLLHLIAGIDEPTSGSTAWPRLDGHPGLHPGRIGIVLQRPALVPALDVGENVALPLLLANHPAGTARHVAAEALDLLGLADLTARLPHELSGGQAQRVAVARAIASGPDLIVADEPTAAVDSAGAAHLVDVLLAAVDRIGAALVLATHDTAVAERLASRWHMTDGALRTVPEPAC